MGLIDQIYQEPDTFPWSTEREVANFLAALIQMTTRLCVLELGTYRGATAAVLSKVCPNGVTTVDIDDRRSPIFIKHFCEDKCLFLKEDSRTFATKRRYDFIYFDSDHSYEQVWAEFLHLRDNMTDDCILAFHDTVEFVGPKTFISEMESTGALNILTLPTPRWCGLTLATLP